MKIGPSTSDPTWPVRTLRGTASGPGEVLAAGAPLGTPAAVGAVVARAAGAVAGGLGGAAAGPQPTAPPSTRASSRSGHRRPADHPFMSRPHLDHRSRRRFGIRG